jgi:hypothetical protein
MRLRACFSKWKLCTLTVIAFPLFDATRGASQTSVRAHNNKQTPNKHTLGTSNGPVAEALMHDGARELARGCHAGNHSVPGLLRSTIESGAVVIRTRQLA